MSCASIQKVLKVEPIPNADKIEAVSILGWKVVCQKGQFKEGDLVVYVEIDSLLPIKPEYEFLRKSSYKKLEDGTEWFRIKTCKLRGQISQGLCLPRNILPFGYHIRVTPYDAIRDGKILSVGDDISEILGIKHYEKPIPILLAGQVKGYFPSFIPKTDEIRAQAIPELLNEFKGFQYYITTKVDGTSMTLYYKDEEVGVCSRNLELKENKDSAYWKVLEKEDVIGRLKDHKKNIAIQGELVGPEIQKNRLGLTEHKFLVFNIWDINEQRYYNLNDMSITCFNLNLERVPFITTDIRYNDFYSIEQLLEMAKGKYEGTNNNREGMVVRSVEDKNFSDGTRMSFKVVNDEYLLRDEE